MLLWLTSRVLSCRIEIAYLARRHFGVRSARAISNTDHSAEIALSRCTDMDSMSQMAMSGHCDHVRTSHEGIIARSETNFAPPSIESKFSSRFG